MNVPNSLSLLRLLLIPVFCAAFLSGPDYYLLAGIALAFSALSDMLDGYFARRLNQITELGKWLDPLADKLTLGAVVVCMWIRLHGDIPFLTPVFAVLILKEILMAAGGLIVFSSCRKMVSSMWWGKAGTAVFYVCMLAVVLIRTYGWGGSSQPDIIMALAVISALVMIYALIRYAVVGIRIMREARTSCICKSAAAE